MYKRAKCSLLRDFFYNTFGILIILFFILFLGVGGAFLKKCGHTIRITITILILMGYFFHTWKKNSLYFFVELFDSFVIVLNYFCDTFGIRLGYFWELLGYFCLVLGSLGTLGYSWVLLGTFWYFRYFWLLLVTFGSLITFGYVWFFWELFGSFEYFWCFGGNFVYFLVLLVLLVLFGTFFQYFWTFFRIGAGKG